MIARIVICLNLFTALIFSNAYAAYQSIQVEWTSYTSPETLTVAGFNLYQEGVRACMFDGANTTSAVCTVDIKAEKTNFTLTARFVDGSESPHSAPYLFSLSNTPTIPSPTIKIILLKS